MKKDKESKNKKYTLVGYEDKYTKKDLAIYFTLRILVIIVMIRQIFTGDWNNVFLCILTLFLFTIPTIVQRSLNITLPNALENIILIFIFAAEILGEIHNFYGVFKNWDTILHVLNGFLCGAFGFALIDLLNRTERFHITLTPIFVALVAFCVSMTIGILWEFFEFGTDLFLKTDMQKDEIISSISTVTLDETHSNKAVVIDNIKQTVLYHVDKDGNTTLTTIDGGYLDLGLNDTMKDLFVNFIGAFAFSILGLLYIKNRDEYKFIENFMPMMRKKKEENS